MKHTRTITAFIAGICVGSLVAFGLDMVRRTPSALEMSAIQLLESERAKNAVVRRHFENQDRYIEEMRKRVQAMDGLWQEGEVPVLHMPKEGR